MNYSNAPIEEIKDLIRECLNKLYDTDNFLFERNRGKGVCERSLVFRFAHYLQIEISDMFVDCDFNSSWEALEEVRGNIRGRERMGKPIENPDGSVTRRFVDIIVHKRDFNTQNDFICFEIKKWNNSSASERRKDLNNLRILTSQYGYLFGFHLAFGRKKEKTKWTIFQDGRPIIDNQKVFSYEG